MRGTICCEQYTAQCQYSDACPPGYRRTTIGWVASAKKQETRRNRLAQLIAACERAERMKFV
jgi:uncharacterized protein YdeI (YjbR/CyaY-like superfamily)